MTDSDKTKGSPEDAILQAAVANPLVFISHDARDAQLAEAFSKLLKSVSSGMIKTFRSSDKKGNEGIDFGEEWYKRLMDKLQCTSDVVCLFTERSIDRPWILFEAGVAKGKLNTLVIGLALGVPLTRVAAGPFYQFMNMDDSEADLAKLVGQLARRVPGLELDGDVVKAQVAAFKATESTILGELSSGLAKPETKEPADENAVAKLAEEMKAIPSRVVERLNESGDPLRRRRTRRFHPGMFEELVVRFGVEGDPIGILMAASMLRDESPWLYELGAEVYRAIKTGSIEDAQQELRRLDRLSDMARSMPLFEDLSSGSPEIRMMTVEFPRMLHYVLRRNLERAKKNSLPRRKSRASQRDTEHEG
jgi:hypothetical protein